MVVQDRLLGAGLGAHTFGAEFLSCEERRSQPRQKSSSCLRFLSDLTSSFLLAASVAASFHLSMTPSPILRDAEGRGYWHSPPPALKLMPEWRRFCGGSLCQH